MWNMALCVTSMINSSVLTIHLLQHLCQSCTLWNHYQRPGLTYLYTGVCVTYPSGACAVHIFSEYVLYIDRFRWPRGVFVIQVFSTSSITSVISILLFKGSMQVLAWACRRCIVHRLSKMGERPGEAQLCCAVLCLRFLFMLELILPWGLITLLCHTLGTLWPTRGALEMIRASSSNFEQKISMERDPFYCFVYWAAFKHNS